MKKLFILFVLVTGITFGQDFELTGLPNSTSIDPTDVFMFSTAGTELLYKFTYTNLLGNIDDESFTWTAAHTFSNTINFKGTTYFNDASGAPRLVLQLGGTTPALLGEITCSVGENHLRFQSALQNDTLMTWRQMLTLSNTVLGDWVVGGDWTVNGAWEFDGNTIFDDGTVTVNTQLAFATDAIFILPTETGTATLGALGNVVDGGQLLPVYGRTAILTDTLLLYSKFFLGDHTVYGDWIMNGTADFDGAATFNGTADFEDPVTINDILIIPPHEQNLSSGGAGISVNTSFTILDGHSDGTSIVSPFTASGIADGTLLVIMCDETDTHGFEISDDASTHLEGGNSIIMAAGDMLLLVYRDSDFYQAAPVVKQVNGEGYAELQISGTPTTIAQLGTAYKSVVWTRFGSLSNITQTNDSTLTVGTEGAGLYLLNASFSFTHSVNSTVVHGSLFIDDVEDLETEGERKIGNGGDFGSFSITGLVDLAVGEEVKIKMRMDNDGTITINHANWNLVRISK